MSTPIAQAVTVSGIEAAVCADIANRQQLGIKKYGMTVTENPLHLREWLQHAYEETLDQAIYLKRAIAELDKAPLLLVGDVEADVNKMTIYGYETSTLDPSFKPGDKLAVMYHQAGN